MSVAAQNAPIPALPFDSTFRIATAPATAPVLEVFGDLMCPDTSGAWDTGLKAALGKYEGKLNFVFHPLPLPYHYASYIANQGLFAALDQDLDWKTYMERVYAAQESLGNDKIADATFTEVKAKFAALACDKLDDCDVKKFQADLSSREMDLKLRAAWKYGTGSGMSGTPLFRVNGVSVAVDPTWTLDDWSKFLDPIVNAQQDKVVV